MRKVYMDYASGKPVEKRVLDVMMPFFTSIYGNSSSAHSFGLEARSSINEARCKVADLVGAERSDEIVFTSGGTESNNLAIRGVVLRNKASGNHIVTSSIEHMSVINSCKSLEKQGFEVTFLPVDEYGMVNPKDVEDSLTKNTILVSIMYANGEVGTIQPIGKIGKIVHNIGAIFHVDAVAAAGQIPINVEKDGIDLLSLSSNDLYGPKGIGALYIRRGTRIQPIVYGGGQERGLRSGTENLSGIMGMGKAAELAKTEIEVETQRLTLLGNRFIDTCLNSIPKTFLNGHPSKRLPNNVNLRFSYIEGESIILSLDMEDIACSSGSACASKTLEPSHVLLHMGLKHEEAHGSVLFTLGKHNTDKDVDHVLGLLPKTVKRLRTISPLTPKGIV